MISLRIYTSEYTYVSWFANVVECVKKKNPSGITIVNEQHIQEILDKYSASYYNGAVTFHDEELLVAFMLEWL